MTEGTYHVTPAIGRARHVVTYYPKGLYHDDGSPRAEVRICGNKRDLAKRLKRLEAQGYVQA